MTTNVMTISRRLSTYSSRPRALPPDVAITHRFSCPVPVFTGPATAGGPGVAPAAGAPAVRRRPCRRMARRDYCSSGPTASRSIPFAFRPKHRGAPRPGPSDRSGPTGAPGPGISSRSSRRSRDRSSLLERTVTCVQAPGPTPCLSPSHSSGAEDRGARRGPEACGATIVLAGAFWRQSMKTVPGSRSRDSSDRPTRPRHSRRCGNPSWSRSAGRTSWSTARSTAAHWSWRPPTS
jgi:hypothetical protein